MRNACILLAVMAALVVVGSGCSSKSNPSDDELKKEFTTKTAPPAGYLQSAAKAGGPPSAPAAPAAPAPPANQ